VREKLTGACAALSIAALFLAFAGDAIGAYFTPDDLMNVYGAWFRPWETDRPLGAAFYRVLYAAFGLNPLPYRVGCFVLLVLNLGLLYGFCRRLTGSREAAAFACLLGAYHAHLADLYYSTGTVYDLLCYTFYYGAFLYYLNVRGDGNGPAPRQSIGVLALYICALLSKEMAVTLPLMLVLYDLIYLRRPPLEWLRREARIHWPMLAVTAAYIGRKLTAPGGMTWNPAYQPHFTLTTLMAGWKHYLTDLFYGHIALNHFKIALLWVVLLGIALAARNRALVMGWLVMFLGALPVIFIASRGFYAIYLTLPGWYLFFAAALVSLRVKAVRTWKTPIPRPILQAATFLAAAAVLAPLHWARKPAASSWVPDAQASVRGAIESVRRYGQPVPRGASVLFLDDPYPPEDYTLTFVFHLLYRDSTIVVHRVKALPGPPTQSGYDLVFRLEHGELTRVGDRAVR
jgi:hypothetical protein